MGGMLPLGVGLLVVGLIGLVVFPWGGIIVAVVGLIIILAFVLGFVRRAAQPGP